VNAHADPVQSPRHLPKWTHLVKWSVQSIRNGTFMLDSEKALSDGDHTWK